MFLPFYNHASCFRYLIKEPEEFPWTEKKIKKRLYISEILRFFIILFWRHFQVVFTVIFLFLLL